jgi:O-antigen/teichoic acid export membrane protein
MARFFGKFEPVSTSLTRKVLRELFRLGFLNQIAHITQMLSFRLSYYLLDYFHGEAAVGVYSNAISLTESLWLISKSISLVQYARIANTEDRSYATHLTMRLTKAAFLLSAALLVPLLVLPVDVYTFVFGEGFEGIKPVIWVLAPGVLMYNVSILAGHYFSGLGKYNVNAMVSTIGLFVSVTAYLLLIPSHSGQGAGIAATISYTFNSLFLLILFKRHNRVKLEGFIPTTDYFTFLKKEVRNYLGKK